MNISFEKVDSIYEREGNIKCVIFFISKKKRSSSNTLKTVAATHKMGGGDFAF